MASKLSQCLEDQVQCPICLQQYQDPRILPCLHTYCRRCLQELLGKSSRFSIKCPECRDTAQITDVSSLRVNIWINKDISLLELSKANDQSNEATALLCNNCDNKEPARARCFDCEKFMCNACTMAHERMTVLKNHQLLTLDEIKSKGVPTMEKPRLCGKHKGKKQKLFCQDCKILVCKDCTLIEHKDHKFAFIVDIIDEQKNKLHRGIESVNEKRDEIESALQKVKTMQERVRTNVETVEREIDETINAKIQILEEMRTNLKQDLRNMTEIKMKRLSLQQDGLDVHLASVNSAVEFTQNIVAKGCDSDILCMVAQITQRFNELSLIDVDDEVDQEDEQKLLVDNNVPCTDIRNTMKIKDDGAPDPVKCEIKFLREGYRGADCIIIFTYNFRDKPVQIKKNRILINCPFPVSLMMLFEPSGSREIGSLRNRWVVEGNQNFKLPTLRVPGNCDLEIMVDGQPIKDSPVKVITKF